MAKRGHDGGWRVGLGVLEMADQPVIGAAARSFRCQVRRDGSAVAVQVVTREAAFALRCLRIKGRHKAGVPGLPEALPGDDVIVARVPANIEVVGGIKRLGVAKVAGDSLAFFRFGLQRSALLR